MHQSALCRQVRFLRHSSITWKTLAYNQLLLLFSQFILLRMWPLSKKIHKTWLGRTAMSNLSLFSRLQGNMVDFYSDEQLYLFNRFTVQKLKKKISVGHHVHFLWSPSTDTMLSLCYVHLLLQSTPPPKKFFFKVFGTALHMSTLDNWQCGNPHRLSSLFRFAHLLCTLSTRIICHAKRSSIVFTQLFISTMFFSFQKEFNKFISSRRDWDNQTDQL